MVGFHLEPVDDTVVAQATNSPAVLFLVFVWFPCVIFRGCGPSELLSRAINDNDADAMEFLLRTDHRLSDLPAIAQVIRDHVTQGNRLYLSILNGDRSRDKTFTPLDIAVRVAAALIELSRLLSSAGNRSDRRSKSKRHLLNAADLRRLFQAIEFDPQVSQHGIPTQDGAWAKRVQWMVKEWRHADRFARTIVHAEEPA